MPHRIRKAVKTTGDALLLKGAAESAVSTLIRQLAAGMATTLVDLTAFHILLSRAGTAILSASAISFCLALTINYLLGSRYVYRRADGSAHTISARSFFLYAATALISLGLTQAIVWLIAVRLGVWPISAKIAAVAAAFLWTFWASKNLIFTETRRWSPTDGGNKWPKRMPELSAEQRRISADFMDRHLHAVKSSWYGFVEKFNHGYPLRSFSPGCRTLEIGAGIGSHLAYEELGRQEYHAMELLPDLAAQTAGKYPAASVTAGDAQARLPFPDASFDRVLAIHVLEHMPNLPAALEEIRRVIRPSGRLSVVIPCEGGLATRLARNISARPHFEKTYGQSYDWFIHSQHINMPDEIMEELGRRFAIIHRRWYPLFVPSAELNLFIGLTLAPS